MNKLQGGTAETAYIFSVTFPLPLPTGWSLRRHVPGNPADADKGADGVLYSDNCVWTFVLHSTLEGNKIIVDLMSRIESRFTFEELFYNTTTQNI